MIDVISLFSGAGALDLGFQLCGGFQTRLRVEYQQEFCETLTSNQGSGLLEKSPVKTADVRTLAGADLPRRRVRSIALGVVGGPPCESFSSMGRRQGQGDPRGTLVFTFAKLVVDAKADFFVLENVPDLAVANGGGPFADLLDLFSAAGFVTAQKVLTAADFGAATLRRRLFVVGTRGRSFAFPAPTHGRPLLGLEPEVTVRTALAGLPAPGEGPPGVPQAHVRVSHSEEVERRFAALKPGSYDNVRKRSRLQWNRPSPSLVAGDLRGTRSHIHPEEPRELTNRESARIQGFPDEFIFHGSPAAVGKQVANAVPVPLALALARELRRQL